MPLKKIQLNGKVLYSPDSILRIGQIAGHRNDNLHINTVIQFNYNGRVVEKYINDDYAISNSFVDKMFLLRGKTVSYLFLSGNHVSYEQGYHDVNDWLKDFLTSRVNSDSVRKVSYSWNSAFVLTIAQDSIIQIYFQSEHWHYRYNGIAFNDKQIYVESMDEDKDTACGVPFLEYDSVKQELKYFGVNEIDNGISKIQKGIFAYKDSAFLHKADDEWFCPPLESLTDTSLIKTYRIGKYKVKIKITKEYEEAEGGLMQYEVHRYDIDSVKLSSSFQLAEELEGNKDYSKPVFKLQKDSSLVVMEKHFYSPNTSGMCGACWYESYNFFNVQKNKATEIFMCSFNLGDATGYYEFIELNGTRQSGNFFLDKSEERENFGYYSIAWLNNAVLRIRIFDERDTYFRDFRITLKTIKGKPLASINISDKMKRIKKVSGSK